eukprot:TRINITY_DN91459_c0_g1_i1.p1 TRINITY_DN91459_c0_g1~~TRINITY_DN91459_c0_g1_i1.p1  ORF type:complete len:380 (-),score=84.73 TRINITY_DN91459_c0_g1_i1:233-1372(-)
MMVPGHVQTIQGSQQASEKLAGDGTGDAPDNGGCGSDGTHNAVSLLQEYIQSCSDFSPHARILTWNFEQQLQPEDSLLQFRATVSFVFSQVPHYFSGSWQTSKKKAQRDAAERVRRYLAQRSDQVAAAEGSHTLPAPGPAGPTGTRPASAARALQALPESVKKELQHLREVPQENREGRREGLEWEVEERIAQIGGTEYRTILLCHVHSVPHHFAGAWCSSVAAANCDVAVRVLWYFGLANGFSSSVEHSSRVAEGSPPPQLVATASTSGSTIASDNACANSALKSGAEEKTILMQVQNSLQKTFAKDTPAGEKVWIWSYEPSEDDPQVFRAVAEVPALGKTFFGDWCRGKKLAQRNACLVVKAYLDQFAGQTSADGQA